MACRINGEQTTLNVLHTCRYNMRQKVEAQQQQETENRIICQYIFEKRDEWQEKKKKSMDSKIWRSTSSSQELVNSNQEGNKH